MSTGSLLVLQRSQMVRPNSLFCVGRPRSTQFDVRRSRIKDKCIQGGMHTVLRWERMQSNGWEYER
jgi:hypothetical protein